ncbi:MAG TPA: tetratricopeptide repeat protein [Candidatus Competibacteraceae bacterium]|nr:tetratricopeptide repeat protein [Candidatus Competibacteraceae bacterium]HRZ05212.1 tetratricopeptide repeat protein [Candidatus Competibacteraceae bacterium]HSA46571.1 tetratricopeptide repeat protein [Candidatus Competibacteraceae bacterium]
MSESSYVFEVTQHNFASVVEASQQVPVLIDFWVDGHLPCQQLTPLLTKLAQEYQGKFILAKVNADAEQALAAHFRVRSLPTVMVIWQGQIVEQLVGLQPESAYRQIIDRFHMSPGDQIREQVDALWQRGRQKEAIQLLREALKQEQSVELKVILAEKLLQLDQGEEARQLLQSLPVEERERQPVSGLLARLQFADLAQGAPDRGALEKKIQTDPTDSAARRQLAARCVLAGDYEAALEQFMEILRRDPKFEDEAGRKGLIAIFEILGNEDPLVTTYRRRMFSLLH